jgi:uncharacterized protein (TIGR02145 family)
MKNTVLLLAALLISCTLAAQDYKVSFSANGLATETDSVEIENVTQGKSITVYGQDTLHLLGIVSSTESMERSTDVKLYPNPASGTSHLEFFSPEGGTAKLMISDMSGKHLLTRHLETQPGTNRIRISGLKRGTYLLALHQQSMQHTRKLTVTSGNGGILQAEISNTGTSAVSTKSVKADGLVEWQYDEGDILIFTGYGNGHSRIHVYYISLDTDVSFHLISCEDPDGHKYTVTTISGDTWMAENLKTSKYNNNVPIPNLTDFEEWNNTTEGALCYYENDSASHAETFGPLYNFAAATHGDLCPTGWHVATETEFSDLMIHLQGSGYNYDGTINLDSDPDTGDYTAKALSATHSFWTSDVEGAPGNTDYPSYRNRSGFSAVSGGARVSTVDFGNNMGDESTYWSSTSHDTDLAYRLFIAHDYPTTQLMFGPKNSGYSVRCVMD